MNHPAELAVYDYLARATKGETDMAEDIRKHVAADVEAALEKQFSSGPRDKFKLRMSNIGVRLVSCGLIRMTQKIKPLYPHTS